MAGDLKPSTWLGAGYSAGTSYIQLNTNDAGANKLLKQLTDAKANATSGDIRSVALGLVEALYQAFQAQSNASNRTNQMTISRNLSGTNQETFSYTCSFTVTQPDGVLLFPSE